ncbi:RNA polymerase primary sigma factor [Mucilaginibacter sp. OAE612]|uniref:sigma-70 family RNA polymerase sigma factor n=1 Tax=Mucilaginibacter sp. OAE612 TaxID=3156444 RepID=UPI00359ED465
MRDLNITQSITARDAASLEKYFSDIAREPTINTEEEVLLARKIRQGDLSALHRLVKANLRFVVSVAKKYQHQGIPMGDLISEGNLGLLEAAKRFDETRGFKFISYAVWWIRQRIMEALLDKTRMIRLPANQVDMIVHVNRATGVLEQRLERLPVQDEIAAFLETAEWKVKEALHAAPFTHSYDKADTPGNDGYSLLDRLHTDEPGIEGLLEAYQLKQQLDDLLNKLNDAERSVVFYHYGLDGHSELSAPEIGNRLGISAERVRQLRNRAIDKLRESANLKKLEI